VGSLLKMFGTVADHKAMVPVAAVHMLPTALALVGAWCVFSLWLSVLIRTDCVDASLIAAEPR